jgi:hypothetical protein
LTKFIVHYDVPEHFVRMDAFLGTALAAKDALNAFNVAFFDGKLQLDLVVYAPESGGLVQRFGVKIKDWSMPTLIVLGGIAGTIQFFDTPTVQGVFLELFGTTSAEMIVQAVREGKVAAIEYTDRLDDFLKNETLYVETLLCVVTSRTLEIDRRVIDNAKISSDLKHDLASAQCYFYDSLIKDPSIRAVGFSKEDDFPIQRNQFPERAIRPPLKEEPVASDWIVGHFPIRVTSPNFDKDDQANRKWKGRFRNGQNVLFEMLDDDFWKKLKSGEVKFTETTEIEGQLAYKNLNGRSRDHRVIRVMSVNSVKLAEPLSEDDISARLGQFSREGSADLSDFFS